MKSLNPSCPKRTSPGSTIRSLAFLPALIASAAFISAQESASPIADEDEVVNLSPFTVNASEDVGYRATSTMAGTRLSTKLDDVGSAISVLTEEFLEDIGAVDNETALAYALGTEVGGPRGNFTGIDAGNDVDQNNVNEEGAFSNSNSNTRIRGLARADNTRNLFRTDVPWDGYTVNRVDIQRGPNAMLFGLGSPAGVINASTHSAGLNRRAGEVQVRIDQFGSVRTSFDYNLPLVEDQLALRVSALRDRQKFRRDPAFEDDDRIFGALTYAPSFLNGNGKRLEFSANFERGDIESNRPRTIAPYDNFSTFFLPASQGGQDYGTINLGTVEGRTNPNSQSPNTGALFENGPQFAVGVYTADFQNQLNAARSTRNETGGFRNGGMWGANRRVSIPLDRLSIASANPQLLTPEQQLWFDVGNFATRTVQDPKVFDFYNLQFDGPNKREFMDWDSVDFEITNTYFHDKLGFNFAYHQEEVTESRYTWMNSNNNRIYIDLMETFTDIDVESNQVVVSPNPNVGRAYVQHTLGGGSRTTVTDRDAARFTAFGELDFRDYSEGWLGKLLGKHRINYVFEEQSFEHDRRDQRPGGFGPDYYDRVAPGRHFAQFAILANFREYVSDDLRGLSSGDQARLTNVKTDLFAASAGNHSVRFFDTTWIAGDIFGDPWVNPDGGTGTQSQNPENYGGWVTENFNFYNMSAPNVMVDGTDLTTAEYLTNVATATSETLSSNVFVWQGYLWRDSIIGTYGYREDERDAYLLRAPTLFGGTENTSPEVYGFGLEDGETSFDTGSNVNWSVAVHLNRLLGKRDFLPLNVSLYYNEGENTTPGGVSRVNVFGNSIPRQSGATVDKSILLATKDGKYSLRVTDYETSFKNDSFNLGSTVLIQQSLSIPAGMIARMQAGEFNYDNVADPDYLNNTLVPAWLDFANTLETDPRFAGLADHWLENGSLTNWILDDSINGITGTSVSFRGQLTVDTVSRGTEFEFTANPLPNWRIALNASRTKATRDNAPGEAFDTLIGYMNDQIMNTVVGDFPYNEDGTGSIRENRWREYRGVYIPALALNGKTAPEIREWRYNVITNYSFTEGRLDGLSVGGAMRYQDPQILEYSLMRDADGFVVPDLSRPIESPSLTAFDLWVGYRKRLSDKLSWRVQVNLFNAFGENKAIPLNVDPDGTPAAVRVQEGRSWQISNTFEF